MKGFSVVLFCAAFFLPAIVLSSCAGVAPAQENRVMFADVVYENGAAFNAVEGKDWMLLELRRPAETVRIDRSVDLFGLGEIYTAHFEEGRISGMGAPNRFFGPYTVGSGRDLSIGLLASTLMMPLVEPDGLREHEYFAYLSRVTRWDIREGKLELHTSSDDGNEAVLVFVPK